MKIFKKSISIVLFALIAAGTTNVWAMEPQPSNDDGKQENEQSSENCCLDCTQLIGNIPDIANLIASFLEQKDALLGFALVSKKYCEAARNSLSNIRLNMHNRMSRHMLPHMPNRQIKAILAIIAHFSNLISISVSRLQITDEIATYLVIVNKGLQELDLAFCNKLTNTTFQAIAENCPNLQKLKLSNCFNLTDAAVKAITQNCPNLLELALSYCSNLTDAAIETITQNCPNLQKLDLSNCHNVTRGCIAELQAHGITATQTFLLRCL